jgi:hydroxyacylglutathione hydrolase
MGLERRANPFLRADAPDFLKAVGMEGVSPVEVFAAVRARKDKF